MMNQTYPTFCEPTASVRLEARLHFFRLRACNYTKRLGIHIILVDLHVNDAALLMDEKLCNPINSLDSSRSKPPNERSH